MTVDPLIIVLYSFIWVPSFILKQIILISSTWIEHQASSYIRWRDLNAPNIRFDYLFVIADRLCGIKKKRQRWERVVDTGRRRKDHTKHNDMNSTNIKFLCEGLAGSSCTIIGIIYDYLPSMLKEIPDHLFTSIRSFLSQGDRFWTFLTYRAKISKKKKEPGKDAAPSTK